MIFVNSVLEKAGGDCSNLSKDSVQDGSHLSTYRCLPKQFGSAPAFADHKTGAIEARAVFFEPFSRKPTACCRVKQVA